jgi:hypothetical protein
LDWGSNIEKQTNKDCEQGAYEFEFATRRKNRKRASIAGNSLKRVV